MLCTSPFSLSRYFWFLINPVNERMRDDDDAYDDEDDDDRDNDDDDEADLYIRTKPITRCDLESFCIC